VGGGLDRARGETHEEVQARLEAFSETEEMKIPRAARMADALAVLLLGGAAAVAFSGGFGVRPFGVRLSVTSGWRLLVLAVVIAAARHAWIRRPSLIERVLGTPERPSPAAGPQPASGRFHVQVALTFVVLTCLVAFEQIANMRAVTDLGDPLFSVWRLDWVAYQLVRDPLHLFDANIFHPEPRTLAYSDAMLVPGLIAAPLIWAGLDGVFVHNVLMLAAAAFSGVTTFWLVRDLTRSTEAAFVAGAVFAWMPVRWALYPHLELQATLWMPLALLFAHRTVRHGRLRDGLWTGIAVALQALSCLYYGAYLIVFVVVAVPGLAILSRARIGRAGRPLLAGAVVTAAALAPIAMPYVSNRAFLGERKFEHLINATPRGYLTAGPRSRVHGSGGAEAAAGLPLFAGVVPLTLAATSLVPPMGPAVAAYGAASIVAAGASLGSGGSVYPVLYRWLTPFRAFRAADRFGVLVGLGVAVLAGFGVARLARRISSVKLRAGMTSALVALVMVESAPRLDLEEIWQDVPSIYASLPADAHVVLADLPFPQRDGNFEVEYSFLWFATSHHRRLVNGGSGFYPPWYDGLAELMKVFPTDAAVEALRGHGTQFIVIHGAFYDATELARVTSALDARADVKRVATSQWNGAPDYLYEIR
jgi:hypothetical protein